MSMYLSIDTSPPSEISSNTGWGDFVRWVGSLDGSPELSHLVEYGWTEPMESARNELEAALASGSPSPDVAAVGNTIMSLLIDAPVGSAIVVGNGIGGG